MDNKEIIRYALELGLECVKYNLETEKQMYKGSERCSEHCSNIKSLEEDIQIIQTALEKL